MINSFFDLDKFRILEIKTFNNPILGEIDINFTGNEDNSKSLYSTLIIGANGTGKSNILKLIVDIFRELEILHKEYKSKKIVKGLVSIKYLIENDEFYYSRWVNLPGRKGPIIKRNDKDIDYSEILLPGSIIANSFMLTDKFFVPNKNYNGIYSYQGVRHSPSAAGTRTYVRKTVNSLLDSLDNKDFKKKLSRVLRTMNFDEKLYISFTPKYRSIFVDDDFFYEEFQNMFKNWKSFFGNKRKTEPWGKKYFDKLQKEDNKRLPELFKFFKMKLQNDLIPIKRSFYFEYEIINSDSIIKDIEFLKDLQKLDLITYPTITFKKNNENFDVAESSSGEYHFISSMIGILSKIHNNSLVLIDEPELSLHPNWQMKYLDFLNDFFSDFNGCHFIIATHSHFLVSDLKNTNTSIITLKRNENVEAITLQSKTYGWSAEEILYNVFNTPTTRNFYFANEVGEILEIISKGNYDKEEIKAKLIKICDMKLHLNVDDPMFLILEKLQKRFLDES